MIKRLLAVLHARNLEFMRDRSSLGWNLLLPVLLVLGMGFIFSGDSKPLYKVAVVQDTETIDVESHPFLKTRYTQFFAVSEKTDAVDKLRRHQIDLLLDINDNSYWVNSDAPKGYILERLLLQVDDGLVQGTVEGREIRYIDWLLPGILGMNMMFSCLFGVGYVVVRYRKNGFLKRLKATPLRAIEFIGAQLLSRLILIMVITVFVFVGTSYMIGFEMEGNPLALLLVGALGAVSMVSMGLVVAARVTSEELAGGLLNMITWPMMLLSGVWFSMEGSHAILQNGAKLLPLTQMLDAARAITLEGATLIDIRTQIVVLTVMSALFLGLGAALFKWKVD